MLAAVASSARSNFFAISTRLKVTSAEGGQYLSYPGSSHLEGAFPGNAGGQRRALNYSAKVSCMLQQPQASSNGDGHNTQGQYQAKASSGVRVTVDDVVQESVKFCTLDGLQHAVKLNQTATGCSHLDSTFLDVSSDTRNELLLAAVLAFMAHHPLELSLDAIYSTIMQGVFMHVNADPEQHRHSFVAHEDKKVLTVNSLALGSWGNRWDRPVANLCHHILDNLFNGNAQAALKASFSTTGPAQAAAHNMVFMNVVQAYFDYVMITDCGIPHIDIGGCKEDWQTMASTISPLLDDLGLGGWNAQLQAILAHFIRAFDGGSLQERAFWQGILKYNGPAGSGTRANVTGWLTQLFPCLNKSWDGQPRLNPAVDLASPDGSPRWRGNGQSPPCIPLEDFPSSMLPTPFTWKYHRRNIDMMLRGGILGITTTEAGALKPEVGWIVAHDPENTPPVIAAQESTPGAYL